MSTDGMASVKDFLEKMVAAAEAEEETARREWGKAIHRYEEMEHHRDLETQEYQQILGQRKVALTEKQETHGRWLALVGRLIKAMQEFEGKG